MKLHCFGTTGYHPSPSRHTACYFLPEQSILLDAGTAVFRLIEQLRAQPCDTIDIFLTHAHLDHIVGLTFLLDAMAVTELAKVRLHGEQAKLDAVEQHLYAELLFPVPHEFEVYPLESDTGSRTIGEATIGWFPLEHPGGSLGYTVCAGGKKLAYVTDTIARSDAAYHSYIHDSDLLLHECYFGDSHQELALKTGHSWLSAVVDTVRQVKPRRTVLIHVNPLAEILDQDVVIPDAIARELNMSVAVDGQVIEI
jgi:ribonuclease BN (tRNA processing enzyme)